MNALFARFKKAHPLILLFTSGIAMSPLPAGDWPQWRGPDRNGVATSESLASTWPESGLPVLWTSAPIPSNFLGGHSSPIATSEHVYLSLIWHREEPSDIRLIDQQVISKTGYRHLNWPQERIAAFEKARIDRNPRLRGKAFDEWADAWIEENLDQKERYGLGSWVKGRLKQGKNALPYHELRLIGKQKGIPFENHQALLDWIKTNQLSEATAQRLIKSIPNTIKKAEDVALALDAKTGQTLWESRHPGKPSGRKGSSTITLHQDKLLFVGSTHVYCLQAKDGTLLWKQPLPIHDGAASILAIGPQVFVQNKSLLALDLKSGEKLWDQPKANQTQSSPAYWKPSPQEAEVLVVNSNSQTLGLAPETGEILWEMPGGGHSSPCISGDTLALYSKHKSVGLAAYRWKERTQAPELIWNEHWVAPRYSSSPLLYQNHLYLLGGERHLCVDLEKKDYAWKETRLSTIASPVLVDHKLLILENNGSHLLMLDASPSNYQTLARTKIGALWCPSPVISQGRLIIRNEEGLTCYQLP